MILSYFVPERIGSYFLLARHTASVVITPHAVRIAVIRAIRTQYFIEKLIEELIDHEASVAYEERLLQALTRAIQQVPSHCILISVFPSAQTILKVLTVPLMSEEKIKMIIPFEIESTLPFPLAEALIDCVITERDPATSQAHVLVVATRKQFLEHNRTMYEQVQRIPHAITTHLIALWSLFSEVIPRPSQEISLIICIEDDVAYMLLMAKHRIFAARTVSYTDTKSQESFVQEIASTARYFMSTIPEHSQIHHILCGSGAEKQILYDALTDALQAECELITSSKLLHAGTIHTDLRLPSQFLIPIAAALPTSTTETFTLDRKYTEEADKKSLLYQSLLIIGLVSLLFGTIMVTRVLMVHRLRKELVASEQEAIELLKTRLQLKNISKNTPLDTVNAKARAAVSQEEEIWFSLSGKNRSTALLALQELSTHIDRDALGLQLEEVSISESTGTMLLKGEVKDFPAVSAFTEGLRKSDFFKNIPNLQEKRFTAKINLDIHAGGV